MNIREQTENLELSTLSKFAAFSKYTRGRKNPEEPCEIRTEYQRDRDRIVHSKAFRRLKHKTQVFISPKGDHYRTRLTHTLEVSQISRTVARALKLNEDLTEAITLAHDLGHTPFGHAGESALNDIHKGGFKHYIHGVRVLSRIEKEGKGLNLTEEVLNGVLCHTKGEEAFTVEGKIIRTCDKIAYINHDIEDSIRAGILSIEKIPSKFLEAFGHRYSERINTMVMSLVKNSFDDKITMSEEMLSLFEEFHSFMYANVYLNKQSVSEDHKVPFIIGALYKHFIENVKEIPEFLQTIAEEEGAERAVCDYIAGMSDQFASEMFKKIFIPKTITIF